MKRLKVKIRIINCQELYFISCLLVVLVLIGCKKSVSKISDSNQEFKKEIIVNGPNNLKFELVYIKPGKFTMGRDVTIDKILGPMLWEGFNPNEGPPRKVTITKGFYIGKYKVTNLQYCEFLNSTDVKYIEPSIVSKEWSAIILKDGKYIPRPGTENNPADTVPWKGADAFCQRLSNKTGRRFRLPTEAEWEFTARGPERRDYPWGNKTPKPLQHFWESDYPEGLPEPWMGVSVYEVAKKTPFNVTPDGVVGMAGAIGEWVSDYYGKYPNKNEVDPTGPKEPQNIFPWDTTSVYKVLRSSQFALTERTLGYNAKEAGIYGFRILMETENKK